MLTLPIKKKWFDMIASGEKGEEYREDTLYYDSRLKRYEGQRITVCFRNGYRAESPKIICEVEPYSKCFGRVEWGAVAGKRYWKLVIRSVKK